MTRARGPGARAAFWSLGALAYLACALRVSSLFPKTTDQTSYYAAGVAVAHGHVRLGGWMLTPPDFWTSDILLSALLSGVWRLLGRPEASPLLLMAQPAILWTGLVASAIAIARRRGATWPGIAIIATLLGLPLFTMPIAYFPTLSAIHIGSVLYALWALDHAARAMETPDPGRAGRHAAICGVLLMLGVIGDPLVIIGATLPILVLCAARPGDGASRSRRRLMLGAVAIAASIAGRLVLWANTATGGFAIAPLPLNFAAFDVLATNFATGMHDILVLFGADPTGRPVGSALPELTRGVLLLLTIAACVQGARAPLQAWPLLLVGSAIIDLAALVVSDRIGLEGGSLSTARYLFPLWIDLSLLCACRFGRSAGAGAFALLTLCITAMADFHALPAGSSGILSIEDQALMARLETEAPPSGIGSWWASGAFDMASLHRLHVVPAVAGAPCGLQPLVQIRPGFTLAEVTTHDFFVLVPHPRETYDERDVRACFGAPARRFRQGRYDVLIYGARKGASPGAGQGARRG